MSDEPRWKRGYESSIRCPSCGAFANVIGDGGNGLVRVWCTKEDRPKVIHSSKMGETGGRTGQQAD